MYDQREQTISRSSILYGTNADDVWFNLDQFYKDQIQEVNQKLSQLDDGIWGKIIIMEKNKRVAKAYIRAPRFRVDGSCHEFDGQRIGFKSLSNTARDSVVEEIREKIGVVLIKMDQQGNILAKRCEGSSPVIVQGSDRPGAYCQGADVIELRGRLETEKAARVFDMRIFKASIDHELRQSYPDRKKLLYRSSVRISLVKDEPHPFKTPCWFMLINLVALDMLNVKVAPIFPSIPNSTETPPPNLSRCQSISSDLHTPGKHLSVSSSDLYFSPNLLRTPASYHDNGSPVWSEIYEDVRAMTSGDHTPSPTIDSERVLAAQVANSLALGYGGYTNFNRPRWSPPIVKSMDCLYSVAQRDELTASQASSARPFQHQVMVHRLDDDRSVVLVDDSPRRPEPCVTYVDVHQQRAVDAKLLLRPAEKVQDMYGISCRSAGRRSATSAISDSDSSSSSAVQTSQQQEIYESASTNSSNSSSGISCRPSSPSISSETASESHHSADSAFVSGSRRIYGKLSNDSIPSPIPPSASNSNTRDHIPPTDHGLPRVTPDPPRRPQSLFKNTIRSKIFAGFSKLNGAERATVGKRAAMTRYNNIQLDDTVSPMQSSDNGSKTYGARISSLAIRNYERGVITSLQTNSGKSNKVQISVEPDMGKVYRL